MVGQPVTADCSWCETLKETDEAIFSEELPFFFVCRSLFLVQKNTPKHTHDVRMHASTQTQPGSPHDYVQIRHDTNFVGVHTRISQVESSTKFNRYCSNPVPRINSVDVLVFLLTCASCPFSRRSRSFNHTLHLSSTGNYTALWQKHCEPFSRRVPLCVVPTLTIVIKETAYSSIPHVRETVCVLRCLL